MKVSTTPPSSTKAATSNTVGWGSSVSVTSTNAPTICQTTVAEASPTKYPTEAPTSCSSRFSIWYFNKENGKCVNDGTVSDFLVGEYVSMDKCCEAQFPDQEQYEYCMKYLYEDKCCSMENHLWLYDSLLEVCTNDVTMVNENTEFYNEVIDCCKGEFNLSICPIRDVCIPEPPETIITSEPTEKPTLPPSDEPTPAPSDKPTPAPSKEPTPTPSASPTTCADLYSVWYYDVASGKCVTGLADAEKEGFDSVNECCGAQFPDVAEYEFCIEYLHVDTCCLMENNVWQFDGEVCTNEGGMDSEGYDEDFECCVSQFGQFPCPVENICIPEIPEATPPTVQPSTPELVTSAPSVKEIITMEPTTAPVTAEPTTFAPISLPPTEKELVTMVPTPSIVTPEPSTMAPSINEIFTSTPTFGSTPTVSKETTGPPTQVRAGSRAGSTFTEDVNTDCVEHNDKVWSTDSKSMIDVCVYVCTVTTTIYEGEEVYDTKVHETNSECP
ncbi:hypothetical protein ACHAWU_008240 [Discostella pseudostelligera]|uniref:Uncharacterized protein n=1 Tax=Discostella pseudostelligera TaxID=259834 RepID=A0ABD3MAG4_9STRA